MFMAAGAKDVRLPTFDQARAAFDAALLEPPKESSHRELLAALGVTDAG